MLQSTEYFASLHKVRMGLFGVYLNDIGEVLLVKPKYLDGWLLPGGALEAGETPFAGVKREMQEEVGLELKSSRVLALTHNKARGEVTEYLGWVFYGGILSPKEISQIKHRTDEIEKHAFVKPVKVIEYTKGIIKNLDRILNKTLEDGSMMYLEDWEEVHV